MRGLILGLCSFFVLVLPSTAQEVWNLERCVRTALENNLGVQSADLNVESSLLEIKRYQFARLPNLNASLAGGYQFGRTIDPTTNDFIEANTQFSNGQLNAGWLVFNGFRVTNSLKQARINAQASKATAEDTRNSISLLVATAYLNVLFAEEQLQTSQRQVALSNEQLTQSDQLVRAGIRPETERLALASQLAQSEYQVVLSQNGLDQALLNLKQLMLIEPGTAIVFDRPEIDPLALPDPSAFTAESVYQTALQTQPVIRAAELRQLSAEKGTAIAQSGFYPTITLFGGLSSAYSNNFLDYAQPDYTNATAELGPDIPVVINGTVGTIAQYSLSGVTFPTVSFADQLDRNFGKNLGISLSIPIYNNHTNLLAVQQSRIAEKQAQINTQQVRQQLKTDVEQAIQSARAARLQYQSAREAFGSSQAAYQALAKRYELGAANAVEFAQAKANLDNAESQVIIGKYEYLFRMKVLDFYLGRSLTLN
ncbi:MAG: TolC family protein [Saprospiraceae bacterium]|nr:TolC family protein [Saprospiraceae bacterium]